MAANIDPLRVCDLLILIDADGKHEQIKRHCVEFWLDKLQLDVFLVPLVQFEHILQLLIFCPLTAASSPSL